jgi:hypothetical protein
MSASKRADILSALQKVLARHYKPYKAVERSVLEQVLYACCLEDSRHENADESFGRLQESFFDWNEVRVTTVRELTELLRGLRDPTLVATRIKRILHSVFEALYDFDLEPLRKQNLGAAVKQLQQYRGTTPFIVSYVVQNALGGHAVPVSDAALEIMSILGAVSDKEKQQGTVPGLERAIPKNKGAEFASLLQQFAAEFAAAPFGNTVRTILLEIDPDAKARLPKRVAKKAEAPLPPPPAPAPPASAPLPPEKKKGAKPPDKAPTKPAAAKSPEKKKVTKKKTPASEAAASKKKTSKKAPKSIAKKASPSAKKSASKQLARRKPR